MNYISSTDFRKAVRDGVTKAGNTALTRSSTVQPTVLADRQVKFVLSEALPDREADCVDPNGIDLTNYLRNPVVLWAHDHHAPPIARCISIGVEAGRLVGVAEFVPASVPVAGPTAEMALQMIKIGFLNAVSIGFRPVEFDFNNDGGMDFTKSELLEFSIVTIPCLPSALVVDVGAEPVAEPTGPTPEEPAAQVETPKNYSRERRERAIKLGN